MHYCIDCRLDPKLNKKHNLKRNLIHLLLTCFLVFSIPFLLNLTNIPDLGSVRGINPASEFNQDVENFSGIISRIISEEVEKQELSGTETLNQNLEIEITNGAEKGKKIESFRQVNINNSEQKYEIGQKVVIQKNRDVNGTVVYSLVDKFRLEQLIWLLVIFFVLVIALAGIRGVTAFMGLLFSIFVLINYLVPQILLGQNVFLITFLASLVISCISIYLAHGFSRRTSVALVGGIISICFATFFSKWIVEFTSLSGAVSEEAFHLQTSKITTGINLRGLLLSGIIIGSIGVLDDVTMSQAAAVEEISRANPKLTQKELFARGMSVGQEHVISMVNTLAFAYVGSSLPVILLFVLYNYSDFWVILNSETISEEIIRTLIGSMCLLLAVPITTILSAKFLRQNKDSIPMEPIFARQSKDFSFNKLPINTEEIKNPIKKELKTKSNPESKTGLDPLDPIDLDIPPMQFSKKDLEKDYKKAQL